MQELEADRTLAERTMSNRRVSSRVIAADLGDDVLAELCDTARSLTVAVDHDSTLYWDSSDSRFNPYSESSETKILPDDWFAQDWTEVLQSLAAAPVTQVHIITVRQFIPDDPLEVACADGTASVFYLNFRGGGFGIMAGRPQWCRNGGHTIFDELFHDWTASREGIEAKGNVLNHILGSHRNLLRSIRRHPSESSHFARLGRYEARSAKRRRVVDVTSLVSSRSHA